MISYASQLSVLLQSLKSLSTPFPSKLLSSEMCCFCFYLLFFFPQRDHVPPFYLCIRSVFSSHIHFFCLSPSSCFSYRSFASIHTLFLSDFSEFSYDFCPMHHRAEDNGIHSISLSCSPFWGRSLIYLSHYQERTHPWCVSVLLPTHYFLQAMQFLSIFTYFCMLLWETIGNPISVLSH